MIRRLHAKQTTPAIEPHYAEAVRTILQEGELEIDVPDPLPWVENTKPDKPILMVPAADYHLDELVPLASELEKRGRETVFAVGQSPWERTKRGMAGYPDLRMHWLPTPEEVERDISLLVTLKDTGSMTDWVPDVRRRGVPVIGKVEGAQDFWDSDTPEQRRPYRNFDLVLCQGQFDAESLREVETSIVGSSRLERLWWAPPVTPPETPLALINLNFVYGVRTSDRKMWIESAASGCEATGFEYLISTHPAEKTPVRGRRMTRVSAMHLLPHASMLVSRFSTVPLEALAMGLPFIYYNPHQETVRTFANPEGAFEIATRTAELARALENQPSDRSEHRTRSRDFFTKRVDLDSSSSSETRAARIIEAYLEH